MRIALFLFTNLAVIILFNIMINLIGIHPSSTIGLIITSIIFGFTGSIISLLMSKSMAINAVNGKTITFPSNEIEKYLIKIVSIQSKKVNIGIPKLVIYDAPDINAFATGAWRNSALVAVSTGMLHHMNNDEIEAVIAHEISHIANGDMVTMTLIQGVINTFVIFISRILARVASEFLSSNREDNDNNINENPIIYFIVSTFLELTFGILASVITLWFSRHREFYADAGSAQLVGKDKMISALKKLKNSCEPKEASNIITFCINGKTSNFSEIFMSHPSIDKRIKALISGTYINKFD